MVARFPHHGCTMIHFTEYPWLKWSTFKSHVTETFSSPKAAYPREASTRSQPFCSCDRWEKALTAVSGQCKAAGGAHLPPADELETKWQRE